MKILVTAFEPFGGSDKNSAHLAMNLLEGRIGEHILVKETLPVVYTKSIELLKGLIAEHNPDAVICLGQAAGATGLRIERVAVNLDDTPAPDNDDVTHVDVPIITSGATAYMSTLPTRKFMEASQAMGIPAYLSYTAGNYVCNHIMYGLMARINGTAMIGGFIHIPSAPGQVTAMQGKPSMSSDDAAKGLTAMIEVL